MRTAPAPEKTEPKGSPDNPASSAPRNGLATLPHTPRPSSETDAAPVSAMTDTARAYLEHKARHVREFLEQHPEMTLRQMFAADRELEGLILEHMTVGQILGSAPPAGATASPKPRTRRRKSPPRVTPKPEQTGLPAIDSAAVYRYLKSASVPVGALDVSKDLGVAHEDARDALDALVGRGQATKAGKGRGVKYAAV